MALLAAMALPFVVTNKAQGWVVAILVIIVLTIIGTIFYQLWKTCKKFLGTPPTPPPDKKGNNVARGPALDTGTSGAISMLFDKAHIPMGCFSMIAPQFLTPDGLTYYTGVFMASVYDSVDLVTWELTGTITAWLSDGFIKIQNCDALGNVLSVVTTPEWNTASPLVLFSPQCQPSNQRFFRMMPV